MSLAVKLGRLACRLGPHPAAAWAPLRATYRSHRAIRTATPILAAGKQLQVAHILVKPEEEDVLADLEQRIKGAWGWRGEPKIHCCYQGPPAAGLGVLHAQ